MNVIWVVADTFRRDHLGAYGNDYIKTPALDGLARGGTLFERHYAGGFPTMPTRADHATGRWTMSFMGWEPLPSEAVTLAEILSAKGYHTAAMVDTPFYVRGGMNYDQGFQTFVMHLGQEGSVTRVQGIGNHESRDVQANRRVEEDCNAPRTFTNAMQWLERHYDEDFFLYIDTWDPHEPWDAPSYYTRMYMPDFDGETVQPIYGYWQDAAGFDEARVRKALAAYRGEISMVDSWLGHMMRRVEYMGLLENTMFVFTSDHGFYFGEHGGLFGKMTFAKKPDGTLYRHGDSDALWQHSPLYEELVHIPLIIRAPGVEAGSYGGITSVVDVMPTVLDFLGVERPDNLDGRSLLPAMRDPSSAAGREYAVSTIPFANPGDPVRSVDNVRRRLQASQVTTVTAGDLSLLYSMDAGMSELYDLSADPHQQNDIIGKRESDARELHRLLIRFMEETGAARNLIESRRELRL